MNHALSMFQPNMELSIDTNKVVAVNASRGFFHEKGLDEQLYALRMLEAIAAELHTIIAKNPKHLQIMLDARDLDRIESAKQYRDQQHVKKQEKHAKAVQQYESRKRLSPEERRHENAVIALMDGAGLTREQAEKHIAEAKAKKIG
jgi:hypothetical protein